ncbi:hypothetical protein DL98DRAFT_662418 [Cadophora sp. DSE1049]|nr:hypothetical protein DL98DRAFT_662418 [Cadophora sp. DSE1049]
MSKLTTPRRETFSHEIVGLSMDCNSQLTDEDAPFDGDIDLGSSIIAGGGLACDSHALPTNPQLTQVTTMEPGTSVLPVSEPASTAPASEDSDLAEISSISAVEPSQAQLTIEEQLVFICHKVQKEFLSKEVPAKAENMYAIDQYFGKVEEMHHIPYDSKAARKLYKVLAAILKLDHVPKDAKYRLRRRAMELREKLESLRREGESLNRLSENGIIDNLANMPHSNVNKALALAASPESTSTSASDSPTKRKRQQSPSSVSSDRHVLPAARPSKLEHRRGKRRRVSVEEHKQHMDKEQSVMQSSYDHVCELLTEVDEEIARATARRLRLKKWKEGLAVWGLEERNFKDRLENQRDC